MWLIPFIVSIVIYPVKTYFNPLFESIMPVLTKLGYRDKRMQEAIDVIISKQNNNGRWIMERTFNGRFQVNIEHKGKPSKWITLNALRTLKGYCAK